MDEKTKRYIREGYYHDPQDAIEDIIKLLDGDISVEDIRFIFKESKIVDEKEYGDTIYKKDS